MRRLSAAAPVFLAVVLAFVVVGSSHATLIGLWRFDEGTGTDAVDSSGNGLDGDLRAQTGSNQPDWIDGHTGTVGDTALRFGVGGSRNIMVADYQPVMDSPSASNAFTVAAWVSSEQVNELSTPGTEYGRLFQRWEMLMYMDKLSTIDSTGMTLNLGFPVETGWSVDVYDKTETVVPVSSDSSTSPQWTHVSATYDGTDMRFYVDGTLKYTHNLEALGEVRNLRGDWLGAINIGNRWDVHGSYDRQFVGAIDDVAYFDTALTSTEIGQIMGGDFTGFDTRVVQGNHVYGAVADSLAPTHYYRFGTTGVIAHDSGAAATPIDGVLRAYHGGMELDSLGPGTSDGLPGFETSPGNAGLGPRTADTAGFGSVYLGPGTEWDEEVMTFSGWVALAPSTGNVVWDRVFTNSQAENNFQVIIHDDVQTGEVAGLYLATDDEFIGGLTSAVLPKTAVDLVDTEWHHIFVVRDGDGIDNLTVVIDGVDYSSLLSASGVISSYGDGEGNAYLAGSGAFTDMFSGVMDEVSIWVGEARTVADAQKLYAAGDGSLPLIPGDANVDGTVDESDAAVLAENWGKSNANWVMGDFNKDGSVGAADAAILAANWGEGTTESNPVPEPSTLVLAILGAVGLAAFSRRRKS
ncbi:MAG: PEP-CTERM sorting domain-containing protein [Pirellulales bacterium]|nr:PEP-CTERM sorting domain-containing protein [Pirellulales bacterium]